MLSVVIPAHNSAGTLYECLSSVYGLEPPADEVIVVDDCSTDESVQIASGFPCRVIKLDYNSGPATARNRGAKHANGEIICFLDSDVLLPKDAISTINESFNQEPDIAGIVGLLSNTIRYKDLFSRYKNSYMHYTYLKLPRYVAVFYTSIAVIKRSVFEACGGFDENYRGSSIEDLEFGQRIVSQGYKLLLNKKLSVEHIRHYSLKGLLKTAVNRTSGIIRIRLRKKGSKQKNYVTSPKNFMAGIALSYLFLLVMGMGIIIGDRLLIITGAGLYILMLLLNIGFLNFLRKSYGSLFLIKSCLLMFVDMMAHGFGAIVGVVGYLRGHRY